MAGGFRDGVVSTAVRGLMLGLSLTAICSVASFPGVPTAALAQTQTENQGPRPDPDGDYGQNLQPFQADGPMLAVVSIGSQQVRFYDRTGLIAQSKVSTGQRGHETPEGVFSIIERKVEHNSNLYDDASMPFMQRLTWSGVALHEGVVPGYRASHGCIRMPSGFAERIFRTTRLQTRVVIVPHDGEPSPISHPVLFQPGLPPVPPAPRDPAPVRAAPQPLPSSDGAEAPMMLGGGLSVRPSLPVAADVAPAAPATPPAPTAAELREKRIKAEQKLAAATKAVEAAKVGVRPRLVEQGQAEKTLRQATALANRAEGRAATLGKAVTAARSDAARASAITSHLEALLELAQARGKEEKVREVAAQKAAAVLSVQDQVKKLDAERQAAQNESRSLARKLSPITLFVSRQTGRVYVRQATLPVMDVPVTIRDPEKPLGTHVFTALEAEAGDDAVKWLAVTVDATGNAAAEPEPTNRKRKTEAPRHNRHDHLQASRAALDRIELPPAVLARVQPALQPGSTLIISDLGQSVETGPGTDIVVQTKGEEAAIQSIANFVAKKKAEAAEQASYRPSSRRDREGARWRSRYRDDDDGGWFRW